MLAASLVLTTSADSPEVRGLLSPSTAFSPKTWVLSENFKQSSRGRTLTPEALAAIQGGDAEDADEGDEVDRVQSVTAASSPTRDNAYVCPSDMVMVALSARNYCIDIHD